jgi:hypothetical protein
MTTTYKSYIRQADGSQWLQLPSPILKTFNPLSDLSGEISVDIEVVEDCLVIKAIEKPWHKTIQERFAGYTDGYLKQTELDWGKDVGEETFWKD